MAATEHTSRPNVLLITADDMNYNSPGCFGCGVPGITPNIDRLASEGVRFTHAHVTIAVCQPSRQVLMTGRYPHRNGGEGFEPIDPAVPTLQERLHADGYLNGIIGKYTHLAPPAKYCWDYHVDQPDLGQGRDPELYGRHTTAFLTMARDAGRPFFLMANSHDPHRPLAGSEQERQKYGHLPELPKTRRTIAEAEADVPGFLPDIPAVRREIAQYFSSVHRCDETVGAVLEALEDAGCAANTLVMFLSDNGMALPFAKTNCYLNSTKTPWLARWPGRIAPGTVDDQHVISGVDYTPTVLDALGLPPLDGVDGASFLPVLLGRRQDGREVVFTHFHETAGCKRYPMRCVQSRRYGYIVNLWSDGERVFRNESQSGLAFKAMQHAAQTDEFIAKRVELFLHRVPEEFYDFQEDPDGLNNLIAEPGLQVEIERFRARLLAHMRQTGDPALEAFEARLAPEAVAAFMAQQDAKAEAHRQRTC
ncbi:MAG: sulfatase [Kiritimatiellae bacterium]|nr:sulfatase [Kiritimatiellia bacterium]